MRQKQWKKKTKKLFIFKYYSKNLPLFGFVGRCGRRCRIVINVGRLIGKRSFWERIRVVVVHATGRQGGKKFLQFLLVLFALSFVLVDELLLFLRIHLAVGLEYVIHHYAWRVFSTFLHVESRYVAIFFKLFIVNIIRLIIYA